MLGIQICGEPQHQPPKSPVSLLTAYRKSLSLTAVNLNGLWTFLIWCPLNLLSCISYRKPAASLIVPRCFIFVLPALYVIKHHCSLLMKQKNSIKSVRMSEMSIDVLFDFLKLSCYKTATEPVPGCVALIASSVSRATSIFNNSSSGLAAVLHPFTLH